MSRDVASVRLTLSASGDMIQKGRQVLESPFRILSEAGTYILITERKEQTLQLAQFPW